MSARSKNSVSVGTGHQAGDRNARVHQLVPQCERKAVQKRLRRVVDGLVSTGHEARNGSGDQDAAATPRAHVAPDLLDQIDRAGDVGVDHVPDVSEILVEEGLAQAQAGIGQQRFDRASSGGGIQRVNALNRGEIGLDSVHACAERTQFARRIIDGGFIRDDEQIEAVVRTLPRKFVADAARGAGNDGETAL
jgi:hypothetical protein